MFGLPGEGDYGAPDPNRTKRFEAGSQRPPPPEEVVLAGIIYWGGIAFAIWIAVTRGSDPNFEKNNEDGFGFFKISPAVVSVPAAVLIGISLSSALVCGMLYFRRAARKASEEPLLAVSS
eukprot:gnl/TRDRNA2_/TRDRNA2_140174_c0_seq1.p2 gnl/TRDRNA2_/TRDRNA2_140174_c0~~gnl/TRDRNA2_/TRDRNA2_140174_c0_seq1.p2  ORF type:complete len:120 (-),score=8.87 gnl/TRDRNA2_/TRDRNA2_140174_c0_seq1:85-444(-)